MHQNDPFPDDDLCSDADGCLPSAVRTSGGPFSSSHSPPWLLYLCIVFGALFLLMLVVNVFLCSAMTCSCARDVGEDKDKEVEEFDPYTRSWHGSQYGSR